MTWTHEAIDDYVLTFRNAAAENFLGDGKLRQAAGLFVTSPDEGMHFHMNADAETGPFADYLRHNARVHKAVAVAFIAEVWMALVEPSELDAKGRTTVRASEHPSRREAIEVFVERHGAPSYMWIAFIERREGMPPTLGPWERRVMAGAEGRLTGILPPPPS